MNLKVNIMKDKIEHILREFFSDRENGYEMPLTEKDRKRLVSIAEDYGLSKGKNKDQNISEDVEKNVAPLYFKREIGEGEYVILERKDDVTNIINEEDLPENAKLVVENGDEGQEE